MSSATGQVAQTPDGAVLTLDYLLAVENDAGYIGALRSGIPRRFRGGFFGTEGIDSLGPIVAPGGIVGGAVRVVTTAMSPYNVQETDEVLLIDASLGAVTVNLLEGATHKGRKLTAVRLDFGATSVTYVAPAGESINGQASSVQINPGASYGVVQFLAVGDDGIGFVDGWTIGESAVGTYLELTTGPSITPTVTVMKLGSYLRSIQPYVKGFYLASYRESVVTPEQLQSYDDFLAEDATAGNKIVNLNGANGLGQVHYIKKDDAGANTVTITPNGADTIDGAASLILAKPRASVILVANGVSDWKVAAAFNYP